MRRVDLSIRGYVMRVVIVIIADVDVVAIITAVGAITPPQRVVERKNVGK